jgi:hypothetical protein
MVETVRHQQPADHTHRWRIEEPDGSTSLGTCKICKIIRPFRNSLAETDFVTNEERRSVSGGNTYYDRMEKIRGGWNS